MAYLNEIEQRLERVLDRVVGVPEDRLASTRDLVKHGEAGVALENLCQQLNDDDVAITADMLAELETLAEEMRVRLPVRPRVKMTDPAAPSRALPR